MNSTLPIGDFSRATHLSVKMRRHDHEIGLSEPVDADLAARLHVDSFGYADVYLHGPCTGS